MFVDNSSSFTGTGRQNLLRYINGESVIALVVFLLIYCVFMVYWSITGRGTWVSNLISFFYFFCFQAILLFVFTIVRLMRHKRFVKSWRLKGLQQIGFTVEHRGYYWAFEGNISGYYTKIYYDSDKHFKGVKRSGLICAIIYYKPLINAEGNCDKDQLSYLNKDYSNALLFKNEPDSEQSFHMAYMELCTRWGLFFSYNDFQNMLFQSVKILESEKLQPIDKLQVEDLINEDPFKYGPELTIYRRAIGIS